MRVTDYKNIFKARWDRLANPDMLKTLNKFLLAILIVLVIFLMADFWGSKSYQSVVASGATEVTGTSSKEAKSEVAVQLQEYSFYAKDIVGKELFGRAAGQEGVVAEAISVDDVGNNFGLVGIVPGSIPQAIVENKKTEKTYYLKKGDSLEGFTVMEISGNKVLMDHNGKKIAISL